MLSLFRPSFEVVKEGRIFAWGMEQWAWNGHGAEF